MTWREDEYSKLISKANYVLIKSSCSWFTVDQWTRPCVHVRVFAFVLDKVKGLWTELEEECVCV